MLYTEYIPVIPLQNIVKTIWVLEDSTLAVKDYEKILPDGCAEMIFHDGDPMMQKENEKEIRQDHHFVYGQLSKFIELKPLGKIAVIGVKFHPWGLASLTDIPQYEISQQRIYLNDIFKNSDKYIHEKMHFAGNVLEKISLVQEFLTAILSIRKNKLDNTSLQFAIEQLYQSNGVGKISDVAYTMNISSRELERRFKKNIGLSPKQIARIYHFQSVLQLKSKSGSLTELAHAAGYYDQSHFIREFRDIAGTNPFSFFKEEKELTQTFVDRG